jgi:hypothetical protein
VAELPKLQHLKLSNALPVDNYSRAIAEAEQSGFALSLFSATILLHIIDIEDARPYDTDEMQWKRWRWRRGDVEPGLLYGSLYDQFLEEDS